MRQLTTLFCVLAGLTFVSCSSSPGPLPLDQLPDSPFYHIAPEEPVDPGNGGGGGGGDLTADDIVPTGDLPATWDINLPSMPESTGLNNAVAVSSDSTTATIVTYSEADHGGLIVRVNFNLASGELTKTTVPLFGRGQVLQNCHAYRMAYYPDGRLAIGAARRNPNSIREVSEVTPGGDLTFQTAVDNTFLPDNFDQPDFDYDIDAQGDPQVLFVSKDGTLGYAFGLFGSYGINISGPAIGGGLSMALTGTDIVYCCRRPGTVNEEFAIRQMQQVLPNDPGNLSFGSDLTFSAVSGTNAGLGSSLRMGSGNSIYAATMLAGGPSFTHSPDWQVAGSWTSAEVEAGRGGNTLLGPNPSLGVLRDGAPVMAYYDASQGQLRLAVSSAPNQIGQTGLSWTTYAIDKGAAGAKAGLFPALAVLRGNAGADKIFVAYGLAVNSSRKLRTVVLDTPAH